MEMAVYRQVLKYGGYFQLEVTPIIELVEGNDLAYGRPIPKVLFGC